MEPKSEKERIEAYLDSMNMDEMTLDEKVAYIAQEVSKIPWGDAVSVVDVLDEGYGNCTGKHKLMQVCLDRLHVRYNTVVCTFKWGEQEVRYPENLQRILWEGEWEHGHNFIQFPNGKYLDVTWDPALEKFGFRVLPKDWTTENSFIGVKNIKRQWEGAPIDETKKDLINALPSVLQERRERFMTAFIEWIKSVRN